MRFLRIAPALLATLAACGEDPLTLSIAGNDGDVAAIAFWRGGDPQIDLATLSGQPITVDADRDRPIYTFVLSPSDFIDADGGGWTPERLAALGLRTDRDAPTADECGRCLARTTSGPQPLPAGSACEVPRFVPGAVWRASSSGAPACFGDASARLCSEGSGDDVAAIEDIRRQLTIVAPGACACRPEDAPSLAQWSIEAIGPDDPWPLEAWTRGADGTIAGFRRELAVRFDDAGAPISARQADLQLTRVLSAVGLRDGAFLFGGPSVNGAATTPFTYYRIEPIAGGWSSPVRVGQTLPVRNTVFAYVADDEPLYLLGARREALVLASTVFACTDDLNCSEAPVGSCPVDGSEVDPEVMRRLDSDAAVIVADRALYYRTAGAGPTGAWTCQQPDRVDWLDRTRTDPTPAPDRYMALGASENRAFVCASARRSACEPERALVLTATVGASPAARPIWRLAHVGSDNVACSSIIERGTDGVRVVFEDLQYVDFDADGQTTGEGAVADAYGVMRDRRSILDVGNGHLLHLGEGNRTALTEPGQPLALLYGPSVPPDGPYRAAVALPAGQFAVFGRTSVTFVDADDRQTTVFASGDPFEVAAAALDPSSPAEGPWRLLVGSTRGELADLTLTAASANFVMRAAPAASAPIRGIAALTPGVFVTAGPGASMLRVTPDRIAALPVDWDDPATEIVENAPTARDECTQSEISPDVFRGITVRDGVGWATGAGGVVLQVLPDRAKRLSLPSTVEVTAADTICSDLPRIIGHFSSIDNNGIKRTGPRVYTLDPDSGATLQSLAENDILAIPDFFVRTARPIGVLRDGPWTDATRTGFAFVMVNGVVQRMLSGPSAYLRVPFRPVIVVSGSNGTVLFGAEQGQLAVGRSSGP